MQVIKRYAKAGLLLLTVVLTMATGMGACSDSDNGDSQLPEAPERRGATNQVMVVFEPCQLGDNGYADKVMEGLQQFNSRLYRDSADVDVSFITGNTRWDMVWALQRWATENLNPVYGTVYERRLLVLTEYEQLAMLDEIVDSLRPTDEVLVLKSDDDDLNQTAASQKLGSRLHGANISAAYSIRRYCRFMDWVVGESLAKGVEMANNYVFLMRLYPDTVRVYRDSITETLREMRGEAFRIDKMALLAPGDELPYSSVFEMSVMKAATAVTTALVQVMIVIQCPFCIIDFGSCNNSMDYARMSDRVGGILPLMLDAQAHEVGERFYVDRDFKRLVFDWTSEWLKTPVGTMPRMECHGGWDGYCTDNLYGPINY